MGVRVGMGMNKRFGMDARVVKCCGLHLGSEGCVYWFGSTEWR